MDTKEKKRPNLNPGENWNDHFDELVANELADVDESGDDIIDDADRFNDIASNLGDVEERFAGILNDNSDDDEDEENPGRKRRKRIYDREVNPDDSYNIDLPDTGPGKSPLAGKQFGKLSFQKALPASVAGVVVGGGAMASFVLSPSILLVHIKEVLHNDRADSTRTNQWFARAYLSYKFKNTGDKCAPGSPKILCKAGSMSREEMQERRNAGFKFTGEEIDKDGNKTGKNAADLETETPDEAAKADKGTRYQIDSMTFAADNHESKSGADALKWAEDEKRPASLVRLTNAFNNKSKFFQNKKFDNMLRNVMKIKNGKASTQYAEGEDADSARQRDAQFNQATGGVSEADQEADARRIAAEASEEGRDRAVNGGPDEGYTRPKTGGFTSLIRAICTGHKVVRSAEAAVQIKHYYRLVGFAMEFLKLADMAKAGAITMVTMSHFMDKITYTGPYKEPEKDGKGFTDSRGFKLASHGDMKGLDEWSKKYILGGTDSNGKSVAVLLASIGVIEALEKGVELLVNTTPGVEDMNGRDAIKTMCRAVNGRAALLAQCAAAAAPLVGVGTAVAPGPGTIASSAFSLQMCGCTISPTLTNIITGSGDGCEDIEKAINYLMGLLAAATGAAVAKVAEKIIENWDIGADTKGYDAGDTAAAGAHQLLATNSTAYATMPGTAGQHQAFAAYTEGIYQTYENVARYEAKQSPFDLENKYSFASILASSIQTDAYTASPFVHSFGLLFSGIPSALSILNTKAYGAYSAPTEKPIERYDCNNDQETKSEDLKYLGVAGDKYCSIVTFTPTPELELAKQQAEKEGDETFTKVIKYMAEKQEANEDGGGTRDDTQGCDSKCEEESIEPSIDRDTGKPNPKSQYAKYIAYCTDQRIANGMPWGASTMPYDAGSARDQDWFTGKQCLKETPMMKNFRMWHILCAHIGTGDGTSSCYEEDTTAATANSTCGDGSTESIYECALQYDNYRYLWGGGHGPSAEDWVRNFKANKPAEWTQVLDCSGLVRMATWEAMGVDVGGGATPSVYANSPYWQKINPTEARKGDIIALGSNDAEGHVAIIESRQGSGFKIFHASTEYGDKEDNIAPSMVPETGDGRAVAGIYRFVKPSSRV